MSQPNRYHYLTSYGNKLSTHKLLILIPVAAILGVLALVTVFFASADSASNSYATSVESEITAEVDGTHYVTLSAPDVAFSINPTDSAQLSKQSINVSVETNAPGGADLYLSMANSTNALHLNGDTTSTVPAIEATASPVAANALTANTWGYSTDDQTYSAVPTSNSDPALLAAVDGSTVGGSAGGVITASIPVYYAANVDTSIPAGSYSNRLAYSAVVDGGIITEATLTKIEIDGAEVDTMQPEVENTLTVTTNLMTNTYGTPRVYLETTSPAGYQECGSVVVSRNESGYMTITCKVIPTQAATDVTLHIVPKGSSDDRFCTDGTYTPDTSNCEAGEWKWGSLVVEALDIEEPPMPMQDMTPELCDSWDEGYAARMLDTRDGKIYWVGKLPDGNCWMTQNLDLDLSTSRTLTPADTNISSNWTPAISTTTTASGYSGSDTGKSYDPGDVYCENTSGTDRHYHVGNYYQWSAATAGYTGTAQPTKSICPAGWTLPSKSRFNALINTGLSDSNFMNAPYYLLRGGLLSGSWVGDRGSRGGYWASTPNGSNYASDLFLRSGEVSASGSYIRYYGLSVRCVAAG